MANDLDKIVAKVVLGPYINFDIADPMAQIGGNIVSRRQVVRKVIGVFYKINEPNSKHKEDWLGWNYSIEGFPKRIGESHIREVTGLPNLSIYTTRYVIEKVQTRSLNEPIEEKDLIVLAQSGLRRNSPVYLTDKFRNRIYSISVGQLNNILEQRGLF